MLETEQGDILVNEVCQAISDFDGEQQQKLDTAARAVAGDMLETVNEKAAETLLPARLLAVLAAGLYQAEVANHMAQESDLAQLGAGAARGEALAGVQKVTSRVASAFLEQYDQAPDKSSRENGKAAEKPGPA